MRYDSLAVANHILRAGDAFGVPIDNLKLQKLLYFAHGFWYSIKGRPLLDEAVQAWKFGPVIYSAYQEFRRFGSDPILARAVTNGRIARLGQSQEDEDVRRFLEAIVWHFRNSSGLELARKTHAQGTPWRRVVTQEGGFGNFEQIPESAIKSYFESEECREDVENLKQLIEEIRSDALGA